MNTRKILALITLFVLSLFSCGAVLVVFLLFWTFKVLLFQD